MSRLLYLRVFNVRDYFIPRVLLAETNISRDLPITNMNPSSPIGVTMQNCSATTRRFGERTCQLSRGEVQCSSELEQQSVSSMGSHVMRDSLHLLVVPLSVIYLFFFFFFIGRTWSTFKLGTKPSVTNFSDRKLNMTAAR